MKSELKEYGGLWFNVSTSDEVCKVIAEAYHSRQRIRVFYGDTKTGRDWLEFYDVIGHIGRSTGEKKIPLLIRTKRSYGGGAILTHCIVKVTKDKQTIYEHPRYHTVDLKRMECDVYADGKVIATAKNEQTAQNILEFLQGTRNKV